MKNLSITASQTMSTKEIAAITEKKHSHVMRDVRIMVSKVYEVDPKMDGIDIKGVFVDCRADNGQASEYRLDRYHTEVLVTGYDVKRRAAVIKRWFDLESGKEQPAAAPIQRSQSREIIEDGMAIAELFGVPSHYAQIEVVKEARRVTGIDYSRLLEQAPAQDSVNDDDVMLEPSAMAPLLKLGDGREVNQLLAHLGLQHRQGGVWLPTKKGESMCSRHSWARGSKSGYNLKWSLAAVRALIDAKR